VAPPKQPLTQPLWCFLFSETAVTCDSLGDVRGMTVRPGERSALGCRATSAGREEARHS